MNVADIRKLADELEGRGPQYREPEIVKVLRALADVLEAADKLSKGSVSGGGIVTFPAHLVANLDQTLARVEALKP